NNQRFGDHVLIIDECQLFIAQSADAMDSILSEARKYGLHIWLCHQTMAQVPERLRGGLQNTGMDVVFRVGAEDASYLATLIGAIDPLKVKHEVSDEQAMERTHPVFHLPQEQRISLAQELQNLYRGQAYFSWYAPVTHPLKRRIFRRQPMRLLKVKTPFVPP